MKVYKNVLDYVTLISPAQKGIVKHYTGELPIFDHFAVTKQGEIVACPYGNIQKWSIPDY